jgi:hypothetical protein
MLRIAILIRGNVKNNSINRGNVKERLIIEVGLKGDRSFANLGDFIHRMLTFIKSSTCGQVFCLCPKAIAERVA